MDDGRGRAWRGSSDPRRRPTAGFRMHPVRLAGMVADVLGDLPPAIRRTVAGAQIAVVDIPDDADLAAGRVPLARFSPDTAPAATPEAGAARRGQASGTPHAAHGPPPRLTVFRRPVEARAGSRAELAEVLRGAVSRAVAEALGLPVDPDEEWE
jgi:hypothetical protein